MEATSVASPRGLRIPKPRRVLAALSDERLVERVRSGDGVAFEVLYDRHHRGILAFSRHMLRSPDEAEDAVQQTFIAAFNDLQRDTGRDIYFKAWLYTIARNRCLSVLRARREQASDEIEITTDRLSDDVQQRADLQALLADIAELPDDQREALVLSEVGDLSHADVAAVVGCEVAKVKSLVFQARTALMDRRQARETPCEEIREQLATLRGGALRRSHLRHHLASCPGCQQYRDEVRRQRQMLAVALPVLPSLALKHNVLAAVGVGGGTAGGAAVAAGGVSGLVAKGGLAKVGIAALLATAGAGTAIVATQGNLPVVGGDSGGAHKSAQGGAGGSGGGSQVPGLAGAAGTTSDSTTNGTTTSPSDAKSRNRSQSGSEHGFTPTSGQSNGDAAKAFALTRGKGKHKGITKTHHTSTAVRKARRHRHVRKVRVKHVQSAPVAPQRTRTQSRSAPAPTQTTTGTTTTTTTTPTTTTTAPTSTTPARGGGHGGGKSQTGTGALSLP